MRKKQAFAYGRFFGQMALSVLVLAALGLAAGPKADPAQAVFGFSPSTPSSTAQADRIAPVGEGELTAEAEVAVGPQWQVTAEELEDLSNLEYLKSHFYIVDSRTALLPGDVDAQDFLARDFSLDRTEEGPKVLIFHTHSQEKFADSAGVSEGVWGVGEYLKEQLEQRYGISVLHHPGQYDIVDGQSQILGAYERMEPDIRQVLEENPSIELVIDLHRDGVNESVHLVEEVNGKPCAKIMFFNGMCRLMEDGQPTELTNLANPYRQDNLALSFQMQVAAEHLYPGWARNVYLNAYRYSLHMKPKSLLVEVGAQTNTYEEACNAMELLADVIASVVG